ncbi:hypothetical protein, partial [Burkholderia cenocepacia]|uniref:hypothetical protein n=1 Tax=Burkholderia cenocepacia TaxID=95486 RepID=UPI001BA1999B
LFLVRFISAVLLSGSWSWKPDFLGFLGNRRLQPSTTPGTLPGADESATHAGSFMREASRVSRKSAFATAPIGERGKKKAPQ